MLAVIDRPDRCVVIGAGPGGLCAARWLSDQGLAFDLLERHPDVGGIWDIAFADSPMYESAHFISSRTLSAFRDFPMPEDYPDYPGHRQILAYLRAYADRHDARRHAEFGVVVTSVRPEGDGFVVSIEGQEDRRYAGAILALGQQWTPRTPEVPGRFEGETLHSSAYRSARQVAGRRVLVVGGGNSGCDIANDAATQAEAVFLSLRRGYWFIPKHVFGVPADVFGARGPHLPGWLEQRVLEKLLRLIVGDVTRLGLPEPDHRLFQTHPVLNSQILHALAHGDVAVRGDLRALDGREAEFADGRRERVDTVVFATGYRRSFPIVDASVLGEGDVDSLYLNLAHRRHPGLFVIGFFETDGGAFPLMDLQCELVARLIRARRVNPRAAAGFARGLAGRPPDLRGGIRYLPVDRMANYVRTVPYARALTAAIRALA